MRVAPFAALLGLCAAAATVAVSAPVAAGGPTPTPVIELLAPDLLLYDDANNVVTWVDRSTGEDGHRLTVQFGEDMRLFEVGPNVEQLQLPSDFRPGCPTPGTSVLIEARAFAGAIEGPPAIYGYHTLCVPVTPTSTAFPSDTPPPPPGEGATPTPTAGVAATEDDTAATPPLQLPETGSRRTAGSAFVWVVTVALLLGLTGLAGGAAARLLMRR